MDSSRRFTARPMDTSFISRSRPPTPGDLRGRPHVTDSGAQAASRPSSRDAHPRTRSSSRDARLGPGGRDSSTSRGDGSESRDLRSDAGQRQYYSELDSEVRKLSDDFRTLALPAARSDAQNGFGRLKTRYREAEVRFKGAHSRGRFEASYKVLREIEAIVQVISFQVRKEQFDKHCGEMDRTVGKSRINTLPNEVQQKIIGDDYPDQRASAQRILGNAREGRLDRSDSNALYETITRMEQTHQTFHERRANVLLEEFRMIYPLQVAVRDNLAPQGQRDLEELMVNISDKIENIRDTGELYKLDMHGIIDSTRPGRSVGDKFDRKATLDVITDDFKKLLKQDIDLDEKQASKDKAEQSYNREADEFANSLGLGRASRLMAELEQEIERRNRIDSNPQRMSPHQRISESKSRTSFDASFIQNVSRLRPDIEGQIIEQSIKGLYEARRNFAERTLEHTKAEASLATSVSSLNESLKFCIMSGNLETEHLRQNIDNVIEEEIRNANQNIANAISDILKRHWKS
jgi:hypothetical protein